MGQKKIEKCACCGSLEVPSGSDGWGYICSVCGWEKDGVQNDDPSFWGGANKMSLNQAKEAYKKGIPVE